MRLTTLKPRLGTIPTTRLRIEAVQVERLRGRAAVKRRRDFLDRNPLCVECEKEGRVSAATVPDHVVPLWQGGQDTEDNLQALCAAHHDRKTAAEAAERARGGR